MLSSCHGMDDSAGEYAGLPASDTNPADRADLVEGGSLHWGINEFPGQWNPHHIDGNLATVDTVMSGVLPTPFRVGADGEVRPDPDYVESVDVQRGSVAKAVQEGDGATEAQVVTLRLNPRARWSDGTAITWRDFASMAATLAGERAGFQILGEVGYDRISSVRPGDSEFEVVITFDQPFSEYGALFTPLLPAEYTRDAGRFNAGYRGDIPVTAGPFEVDEVDAASRTLTTRRSDTWWGDPPLLDEITYRALSPKALDSAFQDGEIDVYATSTAPGSYDRAAATDHGEVRAALAPDYRHLTLNGQSHALSDPDVRHAVFLGIDREEVAEAAFAAIDQPAAVLGNRFLMVNQDGYQDNSGEWGEHAPERARELLDGAGWRTSGDGPRTKDGEPLELRFVIPRDHPPARNEARLVQDMLGDVGIAVSIEPVGGDELFGDYVLPGNYDLVGIVNAGGGFPVSESLQQWSEPETGEGGEPDWNANVGRISSPEIDEAMDDALAAHDGAKAREHINKADRLLWEAGHTLPLYQRPELVAVRSDLANIGAPGFGTLDYADIGYFPA
ncbi:peptide/nickel transport system substrate-binding protein [Lipingzhangella halophila]|uniref:Peptide/nickel transport system substrate-binding protein n=1 Tax=Lipingzhangella halophila TaxID=1783352 RepID=A0A7W7RE20_9ACTN|nr:ABC transporter family substrate-binding protein [Lipingzhangella halophila]MBB4930272.1 peptide/nickel transport system substrate-binding protein [Lipingzhangella halophila]